MLVLLQFIYRLSFGLTLAMAVTSSKSVTSGYFRNHLYVTLGLNVLASVVSWGSDEFAVWPAVTASVLSYFGSACWLYEKPLAGKLCLLLVAGVTLAGAWLAQPVASSGTAVTLLNWLDPVGGGLVLGTTIAAMFLGHWYLNTPSMALEPLQRLVLLMAFTILLRAIISGCGLAVYMSLAGMPGQREWIFLAMRWLTGIVAALVVTWMTWQTLRIPNTQSATGILYVGVIVTFIGELTSQLLSMELPVPV